MKTYRGYELVQAIADREIKKGCKFIFRYKDNYEENVVWNGENFCYIDNDGYLLKDVSDCELIYGTFELIEDEEIDIQAIEEINHYDVISAVEGKTLENINNELGKHSLMLNDLAKAVKQLDKRTRKEKEE